MNKSELMTDEYGGYNVVGQVMKRMVIKHAESYVEGDVHTNTIEGFLSLFKRAFHGQHHHYKREYNQLHVVEAVY